MAVRKSKAAGQQARVTAKTGPAHQPARQVKAKPKTPVAVITPLGKKDAGFFELVFEVARQIPRGRVTSYGAIAACLGTRLSARMVGWAMNSAHRVKPRVPAHRVVNRNGLLTGKHHFATPDRMQELLEKEGILVEKDQVVDFKRLFWDPSAI